MRKLNTVLVTGGAGYVGAILIPKLLKKGCKVKVLDLYTYGTDIFDGIRDKSRLEEIKGDICDAALRMSDNNYVCVKVNDADGIFHGFAFDCRGKFGGIFRPNNRTA